jgi:hypothetical protein
MTTAIFIKTCKKDLEWLHYCLRSIWKFGSGFEELVIVADEDCRSMIDGWIEASWKTSIVYVENPKHGYFHMQAVKLMADTYTSCDNILFVDSDCVFYTPFTPYSFMRDGKPILIKTKYETLAKCPKGKDALCWKKPTERIVNLQVEWEYMRRIPMMFSRHIYSKIRERYPEAQEFARNLPGFGGFSEFNLMGAWIDIYDPDSHFITDSEAWSPSPVAKQYWSWGGFSRVIIDEIEGYLK